MQDNVRDMWIHGRMVGTYLIQTELTCNCIQYCRLVVNQADFKQRSETFFISVKYSQTPALPLVHAFMSSRLDYCNSLLIRIPSKNLQKLQQIQKCWEDPDEGAHHTNPPDTSLAPAPPPY